MSAAPWPGESAGQLPALLAAMRDEASLGLKSLRLRVATDSESHYGMLRYDALGSGQVALVVLNNLGVRSTVELHGLPPRLLGQQPTDLLCKECPALPKLTGRTMVEVGGYAYAVLVGLELPRWEPQGYLINCTSTYSPPPIGEMALAQCLVACLHDAKCDSVAVDWIQPHSWPPPAQMKWYGNQVQCHVRGGVDLSRCDKDVTRTHSTITMVK